jgi:hypothetical protein
MDSRQAYVEKMWDERREHEFLAGCKSLRAAVRILLTYLDLLWEHFELWQDPEDHGGVLLVGLLVGLTTKQMSGCGRQGAWRRLSLLWKRFGSQAVLRRWPVRVKWLGRRSPGFFGLWLVGRGLIPKAGPLELEST